MAQLCMDRVRARLSGIPFDYPFHPYTFCLANYFIKGSEHVPPMEGIDHISKIVDIQDIQQALSQVHLSSGITEASNVMIVAPSSPSQANMFFMCFPDEDFDYGLLVDSRGGPDGVTLDDAYTDEMDMIGIGASNPVDPPLSFDFMSGFVTYYDVMSNGNNNDMSLFEYLPVSQHFPLIAPQAPTTLIHDIDDVGDPNEPLSGKSDCDSDSEERKVTPVSGSVESVDFGTSDQPKELKIGSSHLLTREYPEWLANVVLIPKKDGKVRVCVDYRDLNKASLKDDFPLPHIDMLVDSTIGHSMLSFMDGFSRVMSFGLKNARATYQTAATTLFHNMMHKEVELNPKKCTFGVTSGKLLGHIISERGIEGDLEKIRAILDMPALRMEREIKGFLGRLQYISRSIARLTDICEPIFRLLRKNQPTIWNDDCQHAFEKIKEFSFLLKFSGSHTGTPFVSIFFIFRHGFRVHVSSARRRKKLRHYMIEYFIHLVLRLDLLRYLFDRPILTGRLMRWLGGACTLMVPLINRDLACHPVDITFRFDELRYIHLPMAENQFADALATLASMIEIPFLAYGAYHESATAKDKKTLRQLATIFVICGNALYRRSSDDVLLLYIDQAIIDRVMREVHVGVCRPYMGGHMLARKIMRTAYFWLTMETDCCQKGVKPRKFQKGDLVLKVLKGLISDPRGKFKPSWSEPYVIQELTRERTAWLTDLDGNQFSKPVNVDQLKKFYA
ncbi:hypothetical protein CK203_109420 [Vitis vinifera]|uniref:Transposon Ty3-I Gag-Pol polyprotein n=1 Tax=Vitis vinifera TaxID=29760 RepID=A0A438CVX7_VITVI|nr:hypothetical protein CK203_109420 [Vitis vinifera]